MNSSHRSKRVIVECKVALKFLHCGQIKWGLLGMFIIPVYESMIFTFVISEPGGKSLICWWI